MIASLLRLDLSCFPSLNLAMNLKDKFTDAVIIDKKMDLMTKWTRIAKSEMTLQFENTARLNVKRSLELRTEATIQASTAPHTHHTSDSTGWVMDPENNRPFLHWPRIRKFSLRLLHPDPRTSAFYPIGGSCCHHEE
jgi:hypothetical protein